MSKVAVFSGNRAEFGILFPIICELGKYYELDIIFSGAHVLSPWNTYFDCIDQLDKALIKYRDYRIELSEKSENKDVYTSSLGVIYDWTLDYFCSNDIEYGMVLGDRIESYGFALGTFYSRVPLIHVCGGDVTEVANFDTNVRHSISKIANYHMVTSEMSRRVLLQMGEEERRVINIGNPSFDYGRMGYLPSRAVLSEAYGIVGGQEYIGIVTFHPAANKTAQENLTDFIEVIDGVRSSNIQNIIITYPNNDPGHDLIINYLETFDRNNKIRVEKSLGTFNYLGLMKECQCVIIGNSSSGLLETPFYEVPVVNIGERQCGRIRGNNVRDCKIDRYAIKSSIDTILNDYDTLKKMFETDRFIFGDGNAAIKASKFLLGLDSLSKEEKLFKRFVVR